MPLVDADTVAKFCKLPKQRIYEAAKSGLIPSVRIGRSLRFDESELRRWAKRGGTSLEQKGSKDGKEAV